MGSRARFQSAIVLAQLRNELITTSEIGVGEIPGEHSSTIWASVGSAWWSWLIADGEPK